MATTEKEIYKTVCEELRNSEKLSYVKKVYEGWRTGLTSDHTPCIIVEVGPISEKGSTVYKGLVRFTIQLEIIALAVVRDKNKQILGDDAHKGILDFIEDIRNTLINDYTLNNLVENIHFPSISPGDYISYPLRSVSLLLSVDFRRLY